MHHFVIAPTGKFSFLQLSLHCFAFFLKCRCFENDFFIQQCHHDIGIK